MHPDPPRRAIIRRATAADAQDLTSLTDRSSDTWSYPTGFFDWAPDSSTVTPEEIASTPVHVLEGDGRILGYSSLSGEPPTMTLEKLFVEPDEMGTGLGRRLWDHAATFARALGAETLLIDADSHAAPFYRAMGAEWVADKPTPNPDWTLQSYRYRLTS